MLYNAQVEGQPASNSDLDTGIARSGVNRTMALLNPAPVEDRAETLFRGKGTR